LAGEPMERVKQRIDPEVCTYRDPETNIITVEILLPLVDKDHIYIKVRNDAILVKAENDEIEYFKYIYLSMRLKKEMGKAIYENDILRITVPVQD
jgi:HSP20 family molecular chaperone IbpA